MEEWWHMELPNFEIFPCHRLCALSPVVVSSHAYKAASHLSVSIVHAPKRQKPNGKAARHNNSPAHPRILAETSAQAQRGAAFGGAAATASVAEKSHPIPGGGGTAVGGLPLPTGGVLGPLAPHGVLPVPAGTGATKPAAAAAGAAGLAQSSLARAGGGGGISAATTGGGVSVAWGRGAYAAGGATGPPKRQRHKVSSKDLTEEQRIERRLVRRGLDVWFSRGWAFVVSRAWVQASDLADRLYSRCLVPDDAVCVGVACHSPHVELSCSCRRAVV